MTYFEDFRLAFLADTKEGRAEAERLVKSLFRRCRRDRFVPPTLEEVEQYIQEKGYGMSAVDFWEFYACKGWMVGKVSMIDWKMAVNRWEREDKAKRQNRPANADTYHQKWLQKTQARKQQAEAEERERRETLAEIWREAGNDR